MEDKIDKGIPIPSLGRGRYKRLVDQMKVGDSVLFVDEDHGFKKDYSDSMATSLILAFKKNGMKGCKRIMKKPNNGPTETRVWRIE